MIHQETITYFTNTANEQEMLAKFCQEWDYWPYEELISSLEEDAYHLFYAHSNEAPIWSGALLIYSSSFSTDICYIYILPTKRGKKLGEVLLANMVAWLRKQYKSIHEIFLEVKPSNLAAIKLYERLGMQCIANRPSYYRNGEDALVYKMEI